jgi:hypothetical protein
MSAKVDYDFEQFHLERKVGAGWASVDAHMNGFSYQEGYQPDANGVLIYQSETATVAMSYWEKPAGAAPLYPNDEVRARYGSDVFFEGRVSDTSWTYAVDADAAKHGAYRRVDFTAQMVGKYEAMMGRIVCHKYIPKEPWIDRIRRFVTVNNWTG